MLATSLTKLFQLGVLFFFLCLFLSVRGVESILPPDRLSPTISRLILNSPYFLLAAGALFAWHFKKTQVTFMNLSLAVSLYLVSTVIGSRSFEPALREQFFLLLNIVLGLNFFFFQFARDRGFLTRTGILRLILLSAQFYALFYFLNQGSVPLSGIFSSHPFMSIRIPIINANLTAALISALLIAVFTASNIRSDKVSSLYSAVAVLILFVTLCCDTPWRPGRIGLYRISLLFAFEGIVMLLSLYSLTWGRVFTDELTGLLNRRTLDDALQKTGGRFSVVMIDIDHFKKFNDTYGHQAGDEVLKFVAGIVKNCGFGTAYRYGGEEFTIISTGKSADQMVFLSDTLRRKVEASSLILSQTKKPKHYGKRVSVTLSMGIAQSSDFITDPEQVITAADAALYRAKKKGRNRVEIEKRKFRR